MSWGRAAKGTPVWYWVPRGTLSPRPVRVAAAGVEYLIVGEFTASALPVPRRRSGPGTWGQRRRGPSAAGRAVGRGHRARAVRSVGERRKNFQWRVPTGPCIGLWVG